VTDAGEEGDAGPGEADAGAGVVSVRILGLPMGVYLRASEHGDELMREFALIAAGTGAGAGGGREPDVPVRLLALVEELRARFSGFTLRPETELAEAASRGDATIDLEYVVPPEAAQATAHLGDLLDEADEFCRAGDLLTLEAPAEAVAFRRWFLGEFVRQAAGRPPCAWSDWKG
jgi:hypothetical protein